MPGSRPAIKTLAFKSRRPSGWGSRTTTSSPRRPEAAAAIAPVLAQALAACSKGDTFACWKLDRVGRSVQHLSKFVAELNARGIHFRTADGNADTSTSNGRLLLNMLSAIAEFERDLIIERTRAGLANARKNGKRLGPPVKWQPEMVKQARRLMGRGDLTAQEVANMLKVSRRTLFNGLKAARDHDELLGG